VNRMNNENQKHKMRWILFTVFVCAFVALVIFTMLMLFSGFGNVTENERGLLVKTFIVEVGIAVIALFYSLFGLKNTQKNKTNDDISKQQLFLLGSYPRSQHPSFFNEVESLLPHSKNITLIATGLNLIWDNHILEILLSRVRSGEANVTICLGNPYSPHVEDRLIEEEMQDRSPIAAKQGIKKHIKNLLKKLNAAGNPPGFKFLLFNHYPTLATLIFDDEIFVYPYGYQVLGNSSPIFHFKDNGSLEAQFFKDNAKLVIEDAIPARDVFLAKNTPNYFSNNWLSLAVFIIPNQNDDIYKFGTSALGYDLRKEQYIDKDNCIKEISNYIGEAAQYGFHLTVADALYFSSNSEIERIKAELSMLTSEFPPFVLNNFTISNKFRDGSDIVLTCEDETGTIEALHHELVSRMYRAAISSNYLSKQTDKVGLATNRRAELMIKKYLAPFILQEFTPHFTLCSAMPNSEEKRNEVTKNLTDIFQNSYRSKPIRVDEIYLLSKVTGEDKWKITETFPLLGN